MSTDKLTGYSIEREGVAGIWKSAAIVGMFSPNGIAPLVYLRRPKWLSDGQWERVLDHIQLVGMPAYFSDEGES